jgi:hypothetical protein
MLFEINENCNLAALVIGDELDSVMVLLSLNCSFDGLHTPGPDPSTHACCSNPAAGVDDGGRSLTGSAPCNGSSETRSSPTTNSSARTGFRLT